MYEVFGFLFVSLGLLVAGLFFLRKGLALHKDNKFLKSNGKVIKGTVHSFYLQKNLDSNDKMPLIQYIEPSTNEIKYFESNLDKGKFFDAYEKGDEVELLYTINEDEILVKINDDKQFFNDGYSSIILGILFFIMSVATLTFIF